jgi:hypothetical protein
MKRTLTSIAMATLCVSLCLLASTTASAQTEQATGLVETPESIESTCPPAQTFTFGSGATRFSFCISTHGNVQNLVSPSASKHITTAEGYIVCGSGFNNSWDTGSDDESYGWNEPIAVSQPGGPHTFPLTIIRQSTDGRFQLRQVFDWEPEQRELFITMVLKNTSAAAITNLMLARYFDGNIDDQWNNIYDGDSDSVWGRNPSSGARHGLMLSALSLAQPHMAGVERETDWFYSKTICPTTEWTGPPLSNNDYVGRLTFKLGTLNPGQIKTVKVLYRRF